MLFASDRGDIVIGWLVKLVFVLGVFGLLGYDALAVGISRFTLIDQGESAARAASESWRLSHDIQLAYNSALLNAEDADPGNAVDTTSFAVDADGTVHLRIERTVATLVLEKVTVLKTWAEVGENVSGRDAS